MKSLHFLYHELRSSKSNYSYVTPSEEFEAHCGLFARLQHEASDGMFRPEVTFDDGHESDAMLAQPILESHGLRGTFFVTAGWTGQRKGYMSFAQLRGLAEAGHRVGAHGMTHALLNACSPAQLEEELKGARQRLEDGLGQAVRMMSLPGGRMDARVLAACEQAGYQQVFTSVPRAEAMSPGQKTVGRLNLTGGTSLKWLEGVLDPASGALLRMERMARIKGAAKLLLGDRMYARVWALGNRQEIEGAEAEAVSR